MMNDLFETKINCLEAYINTDGSLLFNVAVVSLRKRKIALLRYTNQPVSLDELVQNLEQGHPSIILISGKGVLIRHVETVGDMDNEELLERIFPDLRKEEVLFERIEASDHRILVSISRKSLADKLISLFKENGIQVVDCFVGPLVLSSILPLFDNKIDQIHTSSCKISLDHTTIREIEVINSPRVEEYSLGGIKVNSSCILAFAVGFNYLFVNRKKTCSKIPVVQENADLLRIKKGIFKCSFFLLLSLLMMLLINFFVYTAYNEKHILITNAFSIKSEESVIHDSLVKLLNQREDLLNASLEKSGLKSSFFIDRIFESCKDGIKLNELSFSPLIFKQDASTKPEFKPCTIEAQAILPHNIQLSDWIKSIECIPHIGSAEFMNYRQLEDNTSVVKLIIKLK